MPCYDARDDPHSAYSRKENLRRYGVETSNIDGEVACAIMRAIEQQKIAVTLPEFVRAWWAAHAARDARKSR